MIVELFVKGGKIRLVKVAGESLVDESIVDPFADDGTVFSLDERVVIGMFGSRFGFLKPAGEFVVAQRPP